MRRDFSSCDLASLRVCKPSGEGGRDAPGRKRYPSEATGTAERLRRASWLLFRETRPQATGGRDRDPYFQEVAVCPRRALPIRGTLAPSETPLGPCGLRRGVVHDSWRLYRLRREISCRAGSRWVVPDVETPRGELAGRLRGDQPTAWRNGELGSPMV